MTRALGLWLVVVLAACGKRDGASSDQGSNVVAPQAFAELELDLPAGWTSNYFKSGDTWQVVASDKRTTVQIERADERYVASPDAYMRHVEPRFGKNKLVTIERREQVGGGFAMTLAVFASETDPDPLHVTYVVRKLGKIWYHCYAEDIDDEALHSQVIALCRSLRL